MDPSQLIPLLSTLFVGPWGPVAGAGLLIAYQWAKVKWPDLLNVLPHLVPTPVVRPPATPPAHPALEALLKLLGNRAVPVLANAVQEHYAPPEPTEPIRSFNVVGGQ